ncbi:MAG: ATP-binding cassette domain-containing protein [Desulfobacterales bacterium]
MVADALYQIDDVEHRYALEPVLRVETLAISRASIVGLIGPNGSGKSTLLKLLGFIERPSRGEILFKGRPAAPFSSAVRFQVTLLSQEPYLMRRSVFKNIAYGLELRGDRDNLRSRVAEALAWVGLPEKVFAERQWNELSGGEAQRVALAARLVLRPAVLLLDEPTASVDAVSVEQIKAAAMTARNEWGTTLLIASHDWQWLYEVCDEVLQLFGGRVVGPGRLNIFLGPWQAGPDGHWRKELADKQVVLATAPPAADAVAAVDSGAVTLGNVLDSEKGRRNFLKGTVTRLELDKSSRQTIATILVGAVPFAVRVPPRREEALKLYPGREIEISFSPDSVQWITSPEKTGKIPVSHTGGK